jgi:hypothetical protein
MGDMNAGMSAETLAAVEAVAEAEDVNFETATNPTAMWLAQSVAPSSKKS